MFFLVIAFLSSSASISEYPDNACAISITCSWYIIMPCVSSKTLSILLCILTRAARLCLISEYNLM
ncbi:MAG: hypothetical protein AAI946_00800 [Candidatus Hodgkinia cicadicola]